MSQIPEQFNKKFLHTDHQKGRYEALLNKNQEKTTSSPTNNQEEI